MTDADTEPTSFESILSKAVTIRISQDLEVLEVITGIETSNSYAVIADGKTVARAAELNKGKKDSIARLLLQHWRTFDMELTDPEDKKSIRLHHPFRAFLSELEITGKDGRKLGGLHQRATFPFIYRAFDILDAEGKPVMRCTSSCLHPWTFRFRKGKDEVGVVYRRWPGLFAQFGTNRDDYTLEFRGGISDSERMLLLCSALFIDLLYFEAK